MKKIILLLIALFCFSCNKLKEGHIVGKHYESGYYYSYTTFIHSGNSMIPITNIVYDEEDFILEVKGIYEGKERVENWYVTKELYDSLKISSFICKDKRCDTEDNNNRE